MKFKKVNELIEFTVNSKLSYIKDGFVWYKNEEGALFQVTDNREIEKLNKAENKWIAK